MTSDYKQWLILMTWVRLGYIKDEAQAKRVIDRYVRREVKSPFIEESEALTERFRRM